MSKALAIVPEFTPDQLKLIKDTVAKGATDDELKLFLYRCKHMGLDPLKPGQIHFVKYNNSPGTIIVGIEGFRSKAASTNVHSGTKRGVLRDDKGKCIGGWCEVYRKDWTECAREEVSLAEYNTGKGNWTKMPETMIKKVAEVAALRMAFPDVLGGVYSDDEMGQAESSIAQAKPAVEANNETNSIPEVFQDEDYGDTVCTFGRKYKDKRIKDIDPFELNGYVQWLKNQPSPHPSVLVFIDKAEAYLSSREFDRDGKAEA